MEKKIGLVSACSSFTREAADFLNIKSDVKPAEATAYIVFNSFVEEMFKHKNQKGGSIEKDILLPAIKRLNETDFKEPIVLFDMETLMHDGAVAELKKRFELCCLKTDFKNISHLASAIEKSLHKEYAKRLSEICDYVIECNNSSNSNLILNRLRNLLAWRE